MIDRRISCFVSILAVLVGSLPALSESLQWETAVSASSPMSWYKLNETSGTIAYDYGSAGVNGTYGDVVELSQAGLVGTGAYLGGTGSGIKTVYLNQDDELGGDWTAEFIVKVTTLPTESIILCKEMYGFIKLSQTMEFAGQVGYTLKGAYDAGLGYVLPLNEWHHMVFVMTEEEGMRLYVDGILEGQSGEYMKLVRQYLGGQEDRDEMDGVVDETVLYDRALTQDEIEAHADAAFGVVRARAVIDPTFFEMIEPGSAAYSVVMSSSISSDVAVLVDPNVHGELIAVSGGGQDPGYGKSIILNFTPLDWDQEQVVAINSLDDGVNMGLNTGIIKHFVSSPDPNVRDRAMDVSVVITDDDSGVCEGVFGDDFNDGLLDADKWTRVDSRSSARGLTESHNVLNTASGSYAMAVGEWPVFRMTGMASAYEGTMGMFIRSNGSSGMGVRLEFWAGGIGTEWEENVLTIMSGDRSVTYANMAWPGEEFDYLNTNFYWEVLDDGLTVSFTVEELSNSSNRAMISACLPGVGDGSKILLGCDEWGSSADCWYDDVCIFDYPISVEEGGVPAKTAVFENPLSGPMIDDYTIRLDEEPESPVTITATVMDPNTDPGYVGNLVTLREQGNEGNAGYIIDVVLDSGNWQDGVGIEVLAIDDTAVEVGPHIAAVIHSAQSDDVDFDGAFVPAVNVTIYDDDAPYVLIEDNDGLQISEAEALQQDMYTIQLLNEPTDDVAVSVIYDSSQVTASDEEVSFAASQWWEVEAIEVWVVDDDLSGESAEGDPHSTTILHTASGAEEYTVLEVDSVAVSILDDDCGSWAYEPMDFNLDCDVGLEDFAEFAARWLSCTMPYETGCIRIE
jgi:hypothetical protein